MSSMSAYFATVFRLTWSTRAASDLERPAASIDRISFTVSRGTVISSILPGRARQSNRPGKPYGEGRAPGPRGVALLLKLLNFSCSRCSFPSGYSDHFLVNINTGEHAPGERRATQPRAFGASERAAAARAPASRASSAQEVAGLVGCTVSAPCKWEREPLREEPPMPEDRPSKPARTREGRPRPRRTSPLSRPSSRSSGPGAASRRVPSGSWEKGRAPARQTSPRTGRRPCRSVPRVPNGGRAGFSRRSGWPCQATSTSRERSAPPTGTRRPAGGSRRSSTPTAAPTEGAAPATSPRRGARPSGSAGSPASWPGRGSRPGAGRSRSGATAPTRARSRSIRATRSGRASQLPVARGRDTVLGPRRQEGPPRRPQRLRMPLPVARVDIDLRGGGNHPLDVEEGQLSRQLPHGGLLRHHEERDVLREGLGGRQPGGAREEDR